MEEPESAEKRWPGWPGHCVFRLIVPILKVGMIIGRKGELIKKTCEETRARIRVLDDPIGTNDRIVLVFGKEDPDANIGSCILFHPFIGGLNASDQFDRKAGLVN